MADGHGAPASGPRQRTVLTPGPGMQSCEAVLLGRAPADGGLDAASLATLVRGLLGRRAVASRRYQIRCSGGGGHLQFAPHRAAPAPAPGDRTHPRARPPRPPRDDEGFESDNDDDTSSTKSVGSSDDTVSNSSSCCFVDDHVFKSLPAGLRGVPGVAVVAPSTTSSVGTDSANSSGASDTDDLDGLSKPSPSSDGVETFPISEVAFCHTDPQFPKVAVWVVKRPGGSGLETLVFECKSSDGLKRLCSSFQEASRRSKLDHFTHTNRRKDVTTAPGRAAPAPAPAVHKPKEVPANAPTTTTLTPLSSVLVKSVGTPPSIIRTLKDTTDAITQFSEGAGAGLPKLAGKGPGGPGGDVLPLRAIARPMRPEELPPMSRFNLVQRTDGDGVTHIEISRGAQGVKETADVDPSGPSSILSIHTPDVGNFHSPAGDGKGPPSKTSSSRFAKEIESVIRCDVETGRRQRQPAILVLPEAADGSLRKVWAAGPGEDAPAAPPTRPERRKYVKKKSQAPEPPSPGPAKDTLDALKVKGTQLEGGGGRKTHPHPQHQKIVKGQFIRVSVDQPTPVAPPPAAWVAYPQSGPWAPRRKSVEDIFLPSPHLGPPHLGPPHRQARTYRSKSPPARPMAYRYIDTVPQASSTLSKRFFGVGQKLREIGGQYATSGRRRNSIGELAYTAQQHQQQQQQHHQQQATAGGNLKSVIKKGNSRGRMGEYQEPKKVTFSAYATVQVVD